MTLKILTPDTISEIQAEAVFLPGAAGAFEVLRGHAPIISSLVKGELRWRSSGVEHTRPVDGGMAMVENDVITICAE